jgi:hypothetical protein
MSDQIVRVACVDCFAANTGDCSAFARAVAHEVGVPLAGLADDIVNTLRGGGAWTVLADGPAAATAAAAGKLVVAGLKGSEQATPNAHGHVVVVVAGAPYQGIYPYAYWGSLGGTPGQDKPIDYAWVHADLPNVTFASHDIPAPVASTVG